MPSTKEKETVMDKETSNKLETAVLERLYAMYPDEPGAKGLIRQIARIATQATIITLQEYEKLNSKENE